MRSRRCSGEYFEKAATRYLVRRSADAYRTRVFGRYLPLALRRVQEAIPVGYIRALAIA